jgi:hypothetical protein
LLYVYPEAELHLGIARESKKYLLSNHRSLSSLLGARREKSHPFHHQSRAPRSKIVPGHNVCPQKHNSRLQSVPSVSDLLFNQTFDPGRPRTVGVSFDWGHQRLDLNEGGMHTHIHIRTKGGRDSMNEDFRARYGAWHHAQHLDLKVREALN